MVTRRNIRASGITAGAGSAIRSKEKMDCNSQHIALSGYDPLSRTVHVNGEKKKIYIYISVFK